MLSGLFPFSSSAASKPTCSLLPPYSAPFWWDCKLSGGFPCIFSAVSDPTRPLVICCLAFFLLVFSEPSCSILLFLCCCVSGWFLGPFPSFCGLFGPTRPSFCEGVLGPFLVRLPQQCLLISYFPIWALWTASVLAHSLLPLPFSNLLLPWLSLHFLLAVSLGNIYKVTMY